MDDIIIHGSTVTIYACPPCRPRWRLIAIGPVSEQSLPQITSEGPMLVTLTNTQKVDVTYNAPVDVKGQPAPVQDGSIAWKTSDATVANPVPSATMPNPNPYSATVFAVGAGACQVWIEADADLGDGVATITGEKIDVTVIGGQAVGFGGVTVGTPVEQ
jgi:hypothetical protein